MRTRHRPNAASRQAQKEASAASVARHIAERRPITLSHAQMPDEMSTGQRAADAVARFGGSWPFIFAFAVVLIAWVVLNSVILARHGGQGFDPYPYILLNLFLSMLASIQAPVILMSQNRQSEKDRQNALEDYEVNLKAELEIMALHEKLDALQLRQWDELMTLQREQLALLAKLAGKTA